MMKDFKTSTWLLVVAFIALTMYIAGSCSVEAEYIQIQSKTTVIEYTKPILKPTYEKVYTEEDIVILSKMVYGEARGCSENQRKAVVWTVLNRVDNGSGNIKQVVTAPSQFHGYKYEHPVWDDIYDQVEYVLNEWSKEKSGIDADRLLTSDYLYFYGSGGKNHFHKNWINKSIGLYTP